MKKIPLQRKIIPKCKKDVLRKSKFSTKKTKSKAYKQIFRQQKVSLVKGRSCSSGGILLNFCKS